MESSPVPLLPESFSARLESSDRLRSLVFLGLLGVVCLHAFVLDFDRLWVARGSLLALGVFEVVASLFRGRWKRGALFALPLALGFALSPATAIVLHNGGMDDSGLKAEDREIARLVAGVWARLPHGGATLKGSLAVRGPTHPFQFFGNLPRLRAEFHHVGEYLVVLETRRKKITEIWLDRSEVAPLFLHLWKKPEKSPLPVFERTLEGRLTEALARIAEKEGASP